MEHKVCKQLITKMVLGVLVFGVFGSGVGVKGQTDENEKYIMLLDEREATGVEPRSREFFDAGFRAEEQMLIPGGYKVWDAEKTSNAELSDSGTLTLWVRVDETPAGQVRVWSGKNGGLYYDGEDWVFRVGERVLTQDVDVELGKTTLVTVEWNGSQAGISLDGAGVVMVPMATVQVGGEEEQEYEVWMEWPNGLGDNRMGGEAITYNGKACVMGGVRNGQGAYSEYNNILCWAGESFGQEVNSIGGANLFFAADILVSDDESDDEWVVVGGVKKIPPVYSDYYSINESPRIVAHDAVFFDVDSDAMNEMVVLGGIEPPEGKTDNTQSNKNVWVGEWNGSDFESWCKVGDGGCYEDFNLKSPDEMTGKAYHTLTVFQDRIWLIGGVNCTDTGDTACKASDEVWSWGREDDWRQETSLPNRIWSHQTVVYDDKLWVIGGATTLSGGSSDDVWYSDGSGWTEWTEADDAGSERFSARRQLMATAVEGEGVYVMGGMSGSNTRYGDVWLFDPLAEEKNAAASVTVDTGVDVDDMNGVLGGVQVFDYQLSGKEVESLYYLPWNPAVEGVLVDKDAPVPGMGVNSGASTTSETEVLVTFGASDAGSGVDAYILALEDGVEPGLGDERWKEWDGGNTEVHVTLDKTNTAGVQSIYLWVKDKVGNVGEASAGIRYTGMSDANVVVGAVPGGGNYATDEVYVNLRAYVDRSSMKEANVADNDVKIYYTLDGENPTYENTDQEYHRLEADNWWEMPIMVTPRDGGTKLRVVAEKNGVYGEVQTYTYTKVVEGQDVVNLEVEADRVEMGDEVRNLVLGGGDAGMLQEVVLEDVDPKQVKTIDLGTGTVSGEGQSLRVERSSGMSVEFDLAGMEVGTSLQEFLLPTVVDEPDVNSMPENMVFENVVEVGGAGGSGVSVERAVKLEMVGEGEVYYKNGEELQVLPLCSELGVHDQRTANSLLGSGVCYLKEDGNLVVWTKHFSIFTSLVSEAVKNNGEGEGVLGRAVENVTNRLASVLGNVGQVLNITSGTVTITRQGREVSLADILETAGGSVNETGTNYVKFAVGDSVQTTGVAKIDLGGFTQIGLGNGSEVSVEAASGKKIFYGQEAGEVDYEFDKQGQTMQWEVHTEGVNAVIRGTKIKVRNLANGNQEYELTNGELVAVNRYNGKAYDLKEGYRLTWHGDQDDAPNYSVTIEAMDPNTCTNYNDVPSEAWYAPYVMMLTGVGAVSGEEVGGYDFPFFRPGREVNRAEAVKMTLAATGIDTALSDFGVVYSDVESGDWFTPYVGKATEMGIVSGYADGTFQPNGSVMRAEALAMLVRANFGDEVIAGCLGRYTETGWTYVFYKDVPSEVWYAPYACVAYNYMGINGVSDGEGGRLLNPNDFANRAEFAQLAVKAVTSGFDPEKCEGGDVSECLENVSRFSSMNVSCASAAVAAQMSTRCGSVSGMDVDMVTSPSCVNGANGVGVYDGEGAWFWTCRGSYMTSACGANEVEEETNCFTCGLDDL